MIEKNAPNDLGEFQRVTIIGNQISVDKMHDQSLMDGIEQAGIAPVELEEANKSETREHWIIPDSSHLQTEKSSGLLSTGASRG